MNIKAFYHEQSSTISYVVFDQIGGKAAVIDSALDFDNPSGRVWTEFADKQLSFIEENKLELTYVLETHAHADHLSAAAYLKFKSGAKIAVGAGIKDVQLTFKRVFNISDEELTSDGDVFDILLEDNDTFAIGKLNARVINTPGHTNDSVTFLIEDNAFVGDTLFMPDGGTARCDFPGGDARTLFKSISKIHDLPQETKIWVCHDYQPNGRELAYETTVAFSRQNNIHVNETTGIEDYVETRETRDKTLGMPQLLYPSIQANIRAGKFPKPDNNEAVYFKVPLDLTAFNKTFLI